MVPGVSTGRSPTIPSYRLLRMILLESTVNCPAVLICIGPILAVRMN